MGALQDPPLTKGGFGGVCGRDQHNREALWVLLVVMLAGAISEKAAWAQGFQLRLDHGHPWRPPFGLERVGKPFSVVIQRPIDRRGPGMS